MSFAELIPAKKLTAPGYFNFSSTQQPYTKKIFAWLDSANQQWVDQVNLFDSLFRLWQSRDYSAATVTRTPYVAYQLQQWGLSWFQGTDAQAAGLVSLVSRSYSRITSVNFQFLFNALRLSPFFWVTNVAEQIVYGPQFPSIFAETLIIYSNSVSLPATPAPQTYIPRAWVPPVGFTSTASSSTFMSRGYLSGGNIIWMTPITTSAVYSFFNVANIAALPALPGTGSLAGVADDSTGDVGAIYYFDGAVWRKTTTPNIDQGQVGLDGSIPTPQPRAVLSPNPDTAPTPITSTVRPPASGPSQGYGMYGGYATEILQANKIGINIELTAAGFQNLGIIINLLRRIKPILNQLSIFYTIQGSSDPAVQVRIKDSGEIAV